MSLPRAIGWIAPLPGTRRATASPGSGRPDSSTRSHSRFCLMSIRRPAPSKCGTFGGLGEVVVMSDRDALLAAIRQAPRDDAPRLVYADWLDENGDSDRAEFIRLQIEI